MLSTIPRGLLIKAKSSDHKNINFEFNLTLVGFIYYLIQTNKMIREISTKEKDCGGNMSDSQH